MAAKEKPAQAGERQPAGSDRKPQTSKSGGPPPRDEPLDEDSLDEVMRECPL